MTLSLRRATQFKKDLKKAIKQGKNLEKLASLIDFLQHERPLPKKYQDHQLTGNWFHYRECHITPDWLLIYAINHETQEVYLARLGSHAELFKQ